MEAFCWSSCPRQGRDRSLSLPAHPSISLICRNPFFSLHSCLACSFYICIRIVWCYAVVTEYSKSESLKRATVYFYLCCMFFVDLLELSSFSLSVLFQNPGWGTASLYNITSHWSRQKKNMVKHVLALKASAWKWYYLFHSHFLAQSKSHGHP